MSDCSNSSVQKFGELLKNKVTKQGLKIYSNECQSGDIVTKPIYNQKDVVKCISSQMIAMQNADCINKNNCIDKLLLKHDNSHFMPVEDLKMYYDVIQKKQTKVDTQFELDTQIINIIDDVGTVNTYKGITQEFDMCFDSKLEDCNDRLNAPNNKVPDDLIDVILPETKAAANTFTDHSKKEHNALQNVFNDHSNKPTDLYNVEKENVTIHNKNYDLEDSKVTEGVNKTGAVKNSSKEDKPHNIQLGTRYSELIDKSMEIEEELDLKSVVINDIAISPSPILNINKLRDKSISSSPVLVYNLNSFEKFEEIAIPIVEETEDLNRARHLIHSQIIGRELFIQSNFESELCDNQHQLSPVLSIGKDKVKESKVLKLLGAEKNIDVEAVLDKCHVSSNVTSGVKEKDDISKSFEDEVLFSSDEETDINKEFQDLPFTCALQTSFYDQPDVLDKTMYVGFQTASNRSIQISTVSFTKAKSFLNEFEVKVNTENQSLRDLVEKCDNSFKANDGSDKNSDKSNTIDGRRNSHIEKNTDEKNENVRTTVCGFKTPNVNNFDFCKAELGKVKSQYLDIKYNAEYNSKFIRPILDKRKLDGFKTASNKIIKLSNQALETCKRVFQDIGLDDSFSVSSDAQNSSNVIKVKNNSENEDSIEKEKKLLDYLNLSKMDDEIIQEFEGEMYFPEDENKGKGSTNSSLLGFKTASDKDIKISDAALAKSKQLFNDIHFSQTSSENQIANRKLLQNKDKIDHNMDEKYIKFQRYAETSFMGFKTANNIHINVSEKALAKIQTVFHDIDLGLVAPKTKTNETISPNLIKSSSKDLSLYNSDFKSNVRKINEVPEETENVLFQNIGSPRNNTEIFPIAQHFEDHSSTSKTHFMGFRTGNNNEIRISTAAMVKTKQIFQDIYAETSSYVVENQSGLFIDEKAVLQKENIHDNDVNEDLNEYFDSQPYVKRPILPDFRIDNKKEVNISKDALDNNNKIQITNQNPVYNENQLSSLTNTVRSFGKESFNTEENFQTANNENVEMSSEVLVVSKNKFCDLDHFNGPDCKEIAFKGFQTANNKPVKISLEALAKTKSIFQGINIDDDNKENNKFGFKGFQTANNKKVEVSSAALTESRKIFSNFQNNRETIREIDEEMVPFIGFQTASNKKVLVSEDAVETSKKMLSEVRFVAIDNEDAEPKQSQVFGIKTVINHSIKTRDRDIYSSIKAKNFCPEIHNYNNVKSTNNVDDSKKRNQIESAEKGERNENDMNTSLNDINLEKLINTQVINNFGEAMNTEDFLPTAKKEIIQAKRPASPILSCPKAKRRRKFETPYTNYKENTDINIKHNCVEQTEIFDPDYKKHKRYTLKDLHKLNNDEKGIHTDSYIFNFDHNNLSNFEFSGKRNDLTESNLNIELLIDYFKRVVNKKLIPDNWLDIQLKLILWKLLSYELRFPKIMSGICTAKNVLKQLKHRYKRELYNAERPALRKILEREDVAGKLLVLCVMDIDYGVEENCAANATELLLTDGWYTVKACIDKTLAKYVSEGKIKIGCKIVTHGAELLNCEQGVAPWEDTSLVRLKLYTNSTRRARWDARLGFHSNAAILSQLSAVKPDGGKVSKLRVLITRVYPPLYVEKFQDGSTVTRSERLEHIHQMKYEAERQALMEKLCEEVEKELSDEESPDSDVDIQRTCPDSGSQIARLMKRCKDPSQFRANLTESQKRLLYDHSMKKRDVILQNIQARVLSKMEKSNFTEARNVVPLLKVRVAGVEEKNGEVNIVKALLSIWKPNEALTEIITEGVWVEIFNVVPTAVRYSELQLSAGKQTIFKPSNFKENEKIKSYMATLHRVYYSIKDLTTHPTMTTDYNEIDTTGMVFQIDPPNREFQSNNQFQNVYLTDEDKNVICVNFWGGVKKFGFENVLDTGQIVACVNLQKRAGNTRRSIQHYRATEFTYFTKTPKSAPARKNIDELSKKISTMNKNKFIVDCVILKNNLLIRNTENYSPYRFNNHDLSKNKIFFDSPKLNKLHEDFNLSGLDFESTFKHTDTQELSPSALARRKQVNEKIAKLKMYGEPPPLYPIKIINKSTDATMSYKSPLIKNNSVASAKSDFPKVTEMNNIPKNCSDLEITCSPVLSVKRTYAKNVNPVRLNFNSVPVEEHEEVDHFAEEFDASPPLSLD